MITVIEYSEDPREYDILLTIACKNLEEAKQVLSNRKDDVEDEMLKILSDDHFTWKNEWDDIIYHTRIIEF